jgi:hypothetical protein
VCWPSSTPVAEDVLAFFLEGAVVAAAVDVAFMVLCFDAWRFRFLTSGIVFDGSMFAI